MTPPPAGTATAAGGSRETPGQLALRDTTSPRDIAPDASDDVAIIEFLTSPRRRIGRGTQCTNSLRPFPGGSSPFKPSKGTPLAAFPLSLPSGGAMPRPLLATGSVVQCAALLLASCGRPMPARHDAAPDARNASQEASARSRSPSAAMIFRDTAVYRRFCVVPAGTAIDLKRPCELRDQGLQPMIR